MPPLRTIDEFTAGAAGWPDELSRRKFIKLMGASIALASATGCTRQPPENIVPYVRQPEEMVPGKPLYYATALTLGGYARGVLIETHEGRPTKIEGNPEHPASLGATDAMASWRRGTPPTVISRTRFSAHRRIAYATSSGG